MTVMTDSVILGGTAATGMLDRVCCVCAAVWVFVCSGLVLSCSWQHVPAVAFNRAGVAAWLLSVGNLVT